MGQNQGAVAGIRLQRSRFPKEAEGAPIFDAVNLRVKGGVCERLRFDTFDEMGGGRILMPKVLADSGFERAGGFLQHRAARVFPNGSIAALRRSTRFEHRIIPDLAGQQSGQ